MSAGLQSVGRKRMDSGTGLNGGGELEFDPADAARLIAFRERLHQWRERREHATFDRLLQAAMDESGYVPESGARGAANIDKFLAYARDVAAEMSLEEFVEELEDLRDANNEPDAPPDDEADAVKIMTVHSAKGLEFPVVFVAALHKGVETAPPVIAFSPGIGLGARWRNPAERSDKDDLFRHALKLEREQREREESDRLLYVAMTRAEERLILSYSSVPQRKAGNWADVVAPAFGVAGEKERDETVVLRAPHGEEWQLRVLVTHQSPALDAVEPAAQAIESPEYLDAPQADGQYDGNVAVTALSAYTKCPRAFYLGRYLGFDPAPATGGDSSKTSAAEFGTQVHALLAGCDVPEAEPEAVKLADVFRQSALGQRLARAERAEREFDFLLAIEDVVIRGQVDLWFEEAGELMVVDYKTDDVTRAQARDRAEEYALQLRLYCMAVERVAGRPPDRAWVHFLRPDAAVEIDLGPSLLQSPDAVVREFKDAQDSLDFPPRESASCKRCPFARDLCPKG
jgi:ATP-dependent exoDNAse (exonuclease V) beta subunit